MKLNGLILHRRFYSISMVPSPYRKLESQNSHPSRRRRGIRELSDTLQVERHVWVFVFSRFFRVHCKMAGVMTRSIYIRTTSKFQTAFDWSDSKRQAHQRSNIRTHPSTKIFDPFTRHYWMALEQQVSHLLQFGRAITCFLLEGFSFYEFLLEFRMKSLPPANARPLPLHDMCAQCESKNTAWLRHVWEVPVCLSWQLRCSVLDPWG